MADRIANVDRSTKETQINVQLNLDGTGETNIDTGVGFFDHMLTALGKHSLIDMTVAANGDLHIDQHHTVEDVGIVIGQAIDQALGDKIGLVRYGWAIVPMDEALVLASIDFSGRGMLCYDVNIVQEKVGVFDTILIPEFFDGLSRNSGMTLHIKMLAGNDPHHIAEAVFKAFAKALDMAIRINSRVKGVPSTKGVL
jgi:imidazoleglycerol-phosphate dehydratase